MHNNKELYQPKKDNSLKSEEKGDNCWEKKPKTKNNKLNFFKELNLTKKKHSLLEGFFFNIHKLTIK